MTKPGRANQVVSFKPTPSSLIRQIRAAAKDSRMVFFGEHARERLDMRGISDLEALTVLTRGEIKGDIEPGRSVGEWKCKVAAPIRGTREVGVLTIVAVGGELFIKTVEWEDVR